MKRAHKKLREAEFFFGKLAGADKELRLDSEEFDFYFSAFLTGTRCVYFMLHHEHYNDVDCRDWLRKQESMLKELKVERNKEVHGEGAQHRVELEMVPVPELQLDQHGHPAYGVHWFGPPGEPPPKMARQTHYLGSTKEDVVAWSRRQLDCFKQVVSDFEEWKRTRGPATSGS